LIEVKDVTKEGIVYRKRRVDTLLRISQKLIKDFGLEKENPPAQFSEQPPQEGGKAQEEQNE
jgi:hypothetical protein